MNARLASLVSALILAVVVLGAVVALAELLY